MQNTSSVSLFDSCSDLDRKPHCLIRNLRSGQRYAVDILHYQVVRSDIVNLAYVGMVERSDRPCFVLKTRARPARPPFDRDHAPQPSITSLPDLAHTACADAR